MANNSGRIIDRYKSYITSSQRKKLQGMYKGYRQTTADELREQYLDNRRSMGRTGAVASAYGLGQGYINRKQADIDRQTDKYAFQLGQQADSAFEKEVVNQANQTIDARNKAAQEAYKRKVAAAKKRQAAAQKKYENDLAAYEKALKEWKYANSLDKKKRAKYDKTLSRVPTVGRNYYYDPKTGKYYRTPAAKPPQYTAIVKPSRMGNVGLWQYTDTGTGGKPKPKTGQYGSVPKPSQQNKPKGGTVQQYTDAHTGSNILGKPTAPKYSVTDEVANILPPEMQSNIQAKVKEIEAMKPAEAEQFKAKATSDYVTAAANYEKATSRLNQLMQTQVQAQDHLRQFKELEAKANDPRYSPEQRRGFTQQMSGLQRLYANEIGAWKASQNEISGLQRAIQPQFEKLQYQRGLLGKLGVKMDDDEAVFNVNWARQGGTVPDAATLDLVSLENRQSDKAKEFWKRANKITVTESEGNILSGKSAHAVYDMSDDDRKWFEQNGYSGFIARVEDYLRYNTQYTTFGAAANAYLNEYRTPALDYQRSKNANVKMAQFARLTDENRAVLIQRGEEKAGLSKLLQDAEQFKQMDDLARDATGVSSKHGALAQRICERLGLPTDYVTENTVEVLRQDPVSVAFIDYCIAAGDTQALKDYLYETTEYANAAAGAKQADDISNAVNVPFFRAVHEFFNQLGFGSYGLFDNIGNRFAGEATPTAQWQYTSSGITQNKIERGWNPFMAQAVDSAAVSLGNNATAMVLGSLIGGVGSAFGSVAGKIASHAPGAIMGLSAAGQAKMDALRQGYGNKAATMYGLLNGVSEAVLQEQIGGLVGFGDRGVFTKALANTVNKVSSPTLRTLINQGLDILSEIGQEEFGNIFENINRSITLGEKRGLFDDFADQAGETAVSTAISTFLLNALHIPAQLRNERGYSSIAKASGMSLKDAKLLLETEAAITNGEQVDPKDLSRYNELTAVLTAAMPENVAKAIADGKMTVADWVTSAEGAVQSKLMGKLSASERTAVQTEAVDHTEKLKGKTKKQQRDYLLAAAPTGKVGSAYYTTVDGKPINIRNLNSTQKANYVLAQKCAKAFEGSVDIVIHDTLPVVNGAMVGSDGRLHIALDATNEEGHESIAYWTLAHEAGHALKIADSKAWGEMFDVLTDYAKNYKDRDGKILYDAIVDSITNQYKYGNDSDAFNDEMFSLIAEQMVGSPGEQWAATLGDNTIFDAIAKDRNASAKAKKGFLGKLKTSVEKLSRQFRDGGFSKERKHLAKIREQLTEAYKRINEVPSIRDAAVARQVERKAQEEARKLREQIELRDAVRKGLKAHDEEFNKQKEAREKKAREDALLDELLEQFADEDRIKAEKDAEARAQAEELQRIAEQIIDEEQKLDEIIAELDAEDARKAAQAEAEKQKNEAEIADILREIEIEDQIRADIKAKQEAREQAERNKADKIQALKDLAASQKKQRQMLETTLEAASERSAELARREAVASELLKGFEEETEATQKTAPYIDVPADGVIPIRATSEKAESEAANGDVSFSLRYNGEITERSMAYRSKHAEESADVSDDMLEAANDTINNMVKVMLPYLDKKNTQNRHYLPEEILGTTTFKNGSYGRTIENTTICFRTLAYIEFTNEIKKRIGRPLTVEESFLASQMLYDIAKEPQCLYCYVSLDRKAYDGFLLEYMKQRDNVAKEFNALSEEEQKGVLDAISKAAPTSKTAEKVYKDIPLFSTFLDGRKNTAPMRARFGMWVNAFASGQKLITAEDLTTQEKRASITERGLVEQIHDAEAYAQAASWAKKLEEYRAYNGDILNMTAATVKKLNKSYGLRFYSFSEYTPAFIVENMQQVRDASLKGLYGLAYTKKVDFAKIFAKTGMNINVSTFGHWKVDSKGNKVLDADGNPIMVMDTLQGADWKEVQALREEFANVGAVFVATDNDAARWAKKQDWIDVVIPFHIVRTGANVAEFYKWVVHNSEQADLDEKGRKKDIDPPEHHNDYKTYLNLCAKRGLTPRFKSFLDAKLQAKVVAGEQLTAAEDLEMRQYMKFVNETRLSTYDSEKLRPVFDENEAKRSFDEFVQEGGYYGDWYKAKNEQSGVKQYDYNEAVDQVVSDIEQGRRANEVDYGRQDIDVGDLSDAVKNRRNLPRAHGQSLATAPTRHSLRATDTEYLSLAEKYRDGTATEDDRYELATQVYEAAEQAMPNSKVRSKRDGALRKVYHYTDRQFWEFRPSERSFGSSRTHGTGYYISTSETEYSNFGKRKLTMYADIQNPFEMSLSAEQAQAIYDKYFRPHHEDRYHTYEPHVVQALQSSYKVFNYLKEAAETNNTTTDAILSEMGFDGIHDGGLWVAFDSSQLKLADPVTYDDNGDIIPLSERFNEGNEDIRYQLRDESEHRGQGYDGYSMSVNARIAYNSGQMPLSKWTKTEILNRVAEIDEAKVKLIENVNLDTLRNELLYLVGWHHTSSMYNRTDFYGIDEDVIEELTEDVVASWKRATKKPTVADAYRGDFHYIEWSGTRSHPKANPQTLTDVNIQEKGSFYIVTDDNGNQLVRKKIGSNGTYSVSYEEEARRKEQARQREIERVANSSEAANQLYNELMTRGYERSSSGNIYEKGRKPSRYDYESGDFFKEGERRLSLNENDNGYHVEVWHDGDWRVEEEAPISDSPRYQQRDFRIDFNVPQLDTKALHEAVKGGEGTVENRFEVKYEKTDSGFAVHITDKDSGKTYDRAETVTEGNAKAEAERAAAAVIRNIKRGRPDSKSKSTAGIYIEPGANAARSSAVPVSYEDEKGNIRRNSKVARTMIEAGWMTDEQAERFADQVHDGIMSYEPVTNAEAKAYAEKQVSEHPAAAQAAWDAMYNSFAIPSDKDLAVGYQLMANAANDGDFDMMLKLGTELREMMTKAGQAIQSMNLLKQMGAVADVYRIDQAVQKMNDDLMKAAKGYFISVNPDLVEALLKTKPDTKEYDKALKTLYKDIASQIKPSLSDALTEYRYLAMLGNPRTHIRNLVGNAVFMPAVAMKNVFGTILEGIRYRGNSAMKTKALAYGKQYGQFAKEDWGKVKTTIKSTGNKYRDMMSDIDNYRNHFGKGLGWLDKLAKFNSKLLEGEDMLFKQAYYRTALAAELSAKKINLNDLRAAIEARDSGAKTQKDSAEFKLLSLYEEARARAIKEANVNTYNDANKFARDLNALSRGGGKPRHMMVEGLLPFKNTPANIVSRSIEYSPVGLINSVTREAVKLHKGEIGANEFFDKIARGLSGSAIFALGVWLAKAGVLVGPLGDDKEDKEKKRRGHQAFSVEIAGKSYTLDWMAPVCIPLFTGVALYEMLEKEGNGEHWSQYAMNAMTGMLEPITKMSMLEGVENLIDSLAYSDSKLEDAALTVGTSYLTQFIPTLSGQIARTSDKYTRRTYSDKESTLPRLIDKFVQTVQKKIPGWNRSLQPYVNELGEAEKEESLLRRIFDNFISPGFRSAISNTKLDKELERLGDPSIYPSAASKSFTYNKATYNLHADEYTAFATARGTTAGTLMNSLIDSKAYQGLTDLDQVKAQAKAIEYANAIAKAGVLNMRGILDSDIDWDELGSWVLKANEYAKLSDSPTALADYIAIKTYTDGMKADGSSRFGNVADYTVTNKDGTTTVKWNDMKYDYLQSLGLSDKERLFLTDAFGIKQDAYGKAEAAVGEVPNLTVDSYTKALDFWQDLTLEKAQKKSSLSDEEYEKWLAGNTNAFKKYLNDAKDLTGQQKFALLTKIGSSDGWEGKANKLRNDYGVSYDDAWRAAYKASTLTSTDEESKNAQYMSYLNSTKLNGKQKFGLYGSFGSSTSSTLEKANAFVTGGTYNKGKDSAAKYGKPSYDALWNAYTAYNGGVQHEAFYDWLSKQSGMNAQQRFACCEFTNSTSAWMERALEANSKMGISYDVLWKIKVYWRNESGQGKKARITAYCKKLGLRQSQVDKLYALKFLS